MNLVPAVFVPIILFFIFTLAKILYLSDKDIDIGWYELAD